jgi:hypothetical protein
MQWLSDGVGSFDLIPEFGPARGASSRRLMRRAAGEGAASGGAARAGGPGGEAVALAGTLQAIGAHMLPQEHRLLAGPMPRVAAADATALLEAASAAARGAAAATPADGAPAGAADAAAPAAAAAAGVSAQLASLLRSLLSQPQPSAAAGAAAAAGVRPGGRPMYHPTVLTAGGNGAVTPAQFQAMLNEVLLPNGQLDWAGLRDVEAMINSMLATGPGAAAGGGLAASFGADPRQGWRAGAPGGRGGGAAAAGGGAAGGARAGGDEGVNARKGAAARGRARSWTALL